MNSMKFWFSSVGNAAGPTTSVAHSGGKFAQLPVNMTFVHASFRLCFILMTAANDIVKLEQFELIHNKSQICDTNK